MQKNIIISLIFSIIIAIFAILNAAAVPINLIFAKINISAALVILISACVGAIIVYSFDAISKMKEKKVKKELNKTNTVLTDENNKLKLELENKTKTIETLEKQIKDLEPKVEVSDI
jgi:uncharacterized integral membrane protein